MAEAWPWRPYWILLISRVVANGLGTVFLERTGTVLQCVSIGPSLEGVWVRAVGTEV